MEATRKELREKAEELKRFSYILDDPEVLQSINKGLSQVQCLIPESRDLIRHSRDLKIQKKKKQSRNRYDYDHEIYSKKNMAKIVPLDTTLDTLQETYQPLNPVLDLWRQPPSAIPVCKVNAYQLNKNSFHFLKTTLSDEVMDAYLSLLVQNRNVLHIDSIVGSAIFNGREHIHDHLRKVDFDVFDACVCAVNEGNYHWVLLVILPKKRQLLYINPLGENMVKQQTVLQYWYDFLRGRTDVYGKESIGMWTIETLEHARQKDGISCGVFVLKFAERYLSGEPLLFPSNDADLMAERERIGNVLLRAETLMIMCATV